MGSKRQFDGCVQTKKPVVSQGTELVQQFKLCLPNLRIDTIQRFLDTALAMLSAQSVNHRDLAPHMPGKSSLEGKQRRAERAIHDPTPEVFVLLMLIQLPAGKLLISIDRTNWEHGETPLNLLVIGAVVEGYTVPLMWVALDHSGSSDTRARMWAACFNSYLPTAGRAWSLIENCRSRLVPFSASSRYSPCCTPSSEYTVGWATS